MFERGRRWIRWLRMERAILPRRTERILWLVRVRRRLNPSFFRRIIVVGGAGGAGVSSVSVAFVNGGNGKDFFSCFTWICSIGYYIYDFPLFAFFAFSLFLSLFFGGGLFSLDIVPINFNHGANPKSEYCGKFIKMAILRKLK